jgi:hypothetical protein
LREEEAEEEEGVEEMEENVEVEERRGKEVKKEEVETEEADARR